MYKGVIECHSRFTPCSFRRRLMKIHRYDFNWMGMIPSGGERAGGGGWERSVDAFMETVHTIA